MAKVTKIDEVSFDNLLEWNSLPIERLLSFNGRIADISRSSSSSSSRSSSSSSYSAGYVSYLADSNWTECALTGCGTWDGSEWDSDDTGVNHEMFIEGPTGWESGFRPSKYRVVHNSIGSTTIELKDASGNVIHTISASGTSGDDLAITFVGPGSEYDIESLRVTNNGYVAPFSVTEIQFFG